MGDPDIPVAWIQPPRVQEEVAVEEDSEEDSEEGADESSQSENQEYNLVSKYYCF